jgi:hypothetical protein
MPPVQTSPPLGCIGFSYFTIIESALSEQAGKSKHPKTPALSVATNGSKGTEKGHM